MPEPSARSPQGLLDLLLSWFWSTEPPSTDEAPRPTTESGVEVPEPVEPPRIRHCSAWCGWSSMATDAAIKRDIALARSLGLTRLDVIVNDHSAARRDRPFDTYTRTRIYALCKAAREAGLEVVLLSWLMPFKDYIVRAGGELNVIAATTAARSVCFDVEEPYTKAVGPMPYEAAAQLVEDQMLELPWGVTAIGYANAAKLEPLVRRASFVIPQCYATRDTPTLPPERVASTLVTHWKKIFPSIVRPSTGTKTTIHVGLAAYHQEGIKGHTIDQARRAAFLDAERTRAVDVVWWSLAAIRGDKRVQAAVKGLTARARAVVSTKPEGIA